MTAPESPLPRRRSVALVVATASVTLAVGVTIAALGGYLRPGAEVVPLPATSPAITEPGTAPEPGTATPAGAEPEPIFAMSEPRHHRDHDSDDRDQDDDDDRHHREHGREHDNDD